jgi:hypothetical protein
MVTVSVGLKAFGTRSAYAPVDEDPMVVGAGTLTVMSDFPAAYDGLLFV